MLAHDRPPLGGEVAQPAADLVERLLCQDAGQRLGWSGGAAEVQGHPYFEGTDWETLWTQPPPPPAAAAAAAEGGEPPVEGASAGARAEPADRVFDRVFESQVDLVELDGQEARLEVRVMRKHGMAREEGRLVLSQSGALLFCRAGARAGALLAASPAPALRKVSKLGGGLLLSVGDGEGDGRVFIFEWAQHDAAQGAELAEILLAYVVLPTK